MKSKPYKFLRLETGSVGSLFIASQPVTEYHNGYKQGRVRVGIYPDPTFEEGKKIRIRPSRKKKNGPDPTLEYRFFNDSIHGRAKNLFGLRKKSDFRLRSI